jgi:hypothetical protein
MVTYKLLPDHVQQPLKKRKDAYLTVPIDHFDNSKYTMPSNRLNTAISANKRALAERNSQLENNRRKKEPKRQWHTSNKQPTTPTSLTSSTTISGRTVKLPQRFKSFRISIKQALDGERHQECVEAIRDEIMSMIN